MKTKTIDIPGKNSTTLYAKTKLIGRTQNACLYGIGLHGGEGNYVIDFDGNKYLDFLSGAAVNTLGYGRRDVVDVYANTALRLQHSCYPYNFNNEAFELAEKLIDITPGDFNKKVLFGMSGSDSIDGAIKVARKFTKKKGIIAFKGSYHGTIGLAAYATNMIDLTEGLYLDGGRDFYHVSFPTKEEQISDVLSQIKVLLKEKEIAACLAEPIQGDSGVSVPPSNFLKELYDLLHEHDAVFIVDEIQTGAGRTGKWWGIDNFGVIPDILACGKGISGGYAPISAVIGEEKMIDSLDKVQHLFTYSGHSPSCAVAKKVLDIVWQENLMENASKIGALIREELQELKNYDVINESRGIGLMLGLEFVDENMAGVAAMRCVENGLYPGFYGGSNEVLRIQPPLTLSRSEALWAVKIVKDVVNEMENQEIPNSTIEKFKKHSCGSICSKCRIK